MKISLIFSTKPETHTSMGHLPVLIFYLPVFLILVLVVVGIEEPRRGDLRGAMLARSVAWSPCLLICEHFLPFFLYVLLDTRSTVVLAFDALADICDVDIWAFVDITFSVLPTWPETWADNWVIRSTFYNFGRVAVVPNESLLVIMSTVRHTAGKNGERWSHVPDPLRVNTRPGSGTGNLTSGVAGARDGNCSPL